MFALGTRVGVRNISAGFFNPWARNGGLGCDDRFYVIQNFRGVCHDFGVVTKGKGGVALRVNDVGELSVERFNFSPSSIMGPPY